MINWFIYISSNCFTFYVVFPMWWISNNKNLCDVISGKCVSSVAVIPFIISNCKTWKFLSHFFSLSLLLLTQRCSLRKPIALVQKFIPLNNLSECERAVQWTYIEVKICSWKFPRSIEMSVQFKCIKVLSDIASKLEGTDARRSHGNNENSAFPAEYSYLVASTFHATPDRTSVQLNIISLFIKLIKFGSLICSTSALWLRQFQLVSFC